MRNLPTHLAVLLTTVWLGCLWSTGYLAVPVLFSHQPDRHLAGMLAGEMFNRTAFVGFASASYLLIYHWQRSGRSAAFWLVCAMLTLSLITHFVTQPAMAELKLQNINIQPYASQFKLLHGISSLLHLTESLLGVWLLLKTTTTKLPRHPTNKSH